MKKGIIVGATLVAAVTILVCLIGSSPYAEINPDSIIEPAEITGHISEKIVGDPARAEIVVYEYADFGCSHCAEANKKLNDLINQSDGKLALVFRNYNIGQFKNSDKAARAATAAHAQGYFGAYKDQLFSNQAEWFYEKEPALTDLFVQYFEKVSDGLGDLDKFKEDLTSDNIKKRLKFEQKMGDKVHIAGTPNFRVDGESVTLTELENLITKNGAATGI
ncbi:thioredoxin domain-containing protein [Candidatus Saccharibacteria bacterium]|nr:thioredoxin domain-containing protein [Candidatus Saccharibacteria bacterium]